MSNPVVHTLLLYVVQRFTDVYGQILVVFLGIEIGLQLHHAKVFSCLMTNDDKSAITQNCIIATRYICRNTRSTLSTIRQWPKVVPTNHVAHYIATTKKEVT